jgi:hypothetical protein
MSRKKHSLNLSLPLLTIQRTVVTIYPPAKEVILTTGYIDRFRIILRINSNYFLKQCQHCNEAALCYLYSKS